MGRLSDITIPTVEVQLSDGNSVPVRGLSLDDMERLLADHGGELEDLFSMFTGSKDGSTDPELAADGQKLIENFMQGDTKTVFLAVLRKLPTLVSAIITMAAGEYDEDGAIDAVRKWPPGWQCKVIQSVILLTLNADGDPKNFWAVIESLLSGINSNLGAQIQDLTATMPAQSQHAPGSGASANG